MSKWYKDGSPYRPSTGTEGMDFECEFCQNCLHQNPDPNSKKQCDILMRAFWYNIGEDKYPREWQYKDDQGICTAFKKWDWNNDGDPDDPDNPKAPPPPPDPNQLNIFPLYPQETDFDKETGVTSNKTVPMSKWITFVKYGAERGKKIDSYRIHNKEDGSHLGWIKWHGAWRQYAFFPEPYCVFEKTCLQDITDFLVELMEERKKKKQNERNDA